MFERPRSGERAVLVHVHLSQGPGVDADGARELAELAASAGALVVDELDAPRRGPDPRFLIGEGKLEELAERVARAAAAVVIFGHRLSPAQERNLEARLGCRVLDRVALILDIFAQRASTFEGKLQVELAQLKHLSTRLVRGWSHLERQKGGIGLRGPGEKQLETDRRLIAGRIRHIEQELAGVRKRRELSRRSRDKAGVPVVSLVGYTNAGKSTLFNRLTGAGVATADRLFATLDPTLRRVRLPEAGKGGTAGAVVVADTVGFVRHLPHDLVAAFRATLEETRRAQLLLQVVDASDPERRAKVRQVNRVLRDIGADGIPQIEVYNKIDACNGAAESDDAAAPRIERDESGRASRVWVSARTGLGIDLLHQALSEHFRRATVERRVHLPATAGRLRARLFELGTVLNDRPLESGGWVMRVQIPAASLERLCRREGLSPSCLGEAAQGARG